MKNLKTIVRIILGLLIIISGANKFGYWINVSYMEDALDFVLSFTEIGGGFLIYALAILEITIGIALLINKLRILAELALLPLMVSIIAFHLFLDLNGIGIALIVFVMNIYLLITDKDKVSGIFSIDGNN